MGHYQAEGNVCIVRKPNISLLKIQQPQIQFRQYYLHNI